MTEVREPGARIKRTTNVEIFPVTEGYAVGKANIYIHAMSARQPGAARMQWREDRRRRETPEPHCSSGESKLHDSVIS